MPVEVSVDLRTQRYEDLTTPEVVGLVAFQRLWLDGEQDQASRALGAALDLEHFISVLPLDAADLTVDMFAEVRELRAAVRALTGERVLLHLLGERTSAAAG